MLMLYIKYNHLSIRSWLVYPSTHPSIHPSIHQSITIDQFIHQSSSNVEQILSLDNFLAFPRRFQLL